MGLDWTALEQGLERTASEKAAAIMAEHAGQTFYGLALHGVPTEEDGVLVLPVLALNSEESLVRALRDEFGEEADDVDEWLSEQEWDDWVQPPLDGSDPPDPDDDEDDEDDDESDDDDDLDDVDADDSAGGFYSRRWDPGEWEWNAVDLVSGAASSVWEKAFEGEVAAAGWEPTALRYYELMVRVVQKVREKLAVGGGKELVCFVADDDHAERLLRASLTPEQLERHFPELVTRTRVG